MWGGRPYRPAGISAASNTKTAAPPNPLCAPVARRAATPPRRPRGGAVALRQSGGEGVGAELGGGRPPLPLPLRAHARHHPAGAANAAAFPAPAPAPAPTSMPAPHRPQRGNGFRPTGPARAGASPDPRHTHRLPRRCRGRGRHCLRNHPHAGDAADAAARGEMSATRTVRSLSSPTPRARGRGECGTSRTLRGEDAHEDAFSRRVEIRSPDTLAVALILEEAFEGGDSAPPPPAQRHPPLHETRRAAASVESSAREPT
jgi:hypothetical protein